jgi:hypothetical protein
MHVNMCFMLFICHLEPRIAFNKYLEHLGFWIQIWGFLILVVFLHFEVESLIVLGISFSFYAN